MSPMPEAFAAALAEAGYPEGFAGIDPADGGPTYWAFVPDEVAWRAYCITDPENTPCFWCFVNDPDGMDDSTWVDQCTELGQPGFPLDCGRADKVPA